MNNPTNSEVMLDCIIACLAGTALGLLTVILTLALT